MLFTNTSKFTFFTLFTYLLAFVSARSLSTTEPTPVRPTPVPQQASRSLTNALRLARGLPLKAPKRRHHQQLAHRAQPSGSFVKSFSFANSGDQGGFIQLRSLTDGNILGYVGNFNDEDGCAALVSPTALSDALAVNIHIDETTNEASLRTTTGLFGIGGSDGTNSKCFGGAGSAQGIEMHYIIGTDEIMLSGIANGLPVTIGVGSDNQLLVDDKVHAGEKGVNLFFVPAKQ
ncbi:hypothetical protein GYMLUDRAFT_37915 [Collybiopsis luxurians FD-317 M1]|nr:hypothetical protein GYMLUDRAFT_37915 [Collybiopsis luxurians FD-317 M1]